MRDMILIAMIDDIEAMELALEDKYGEHFAENLAAEHLSEEKYHQLMAIEDQDERRRQIALALNDGVENGTIDADILFENDDIKDWVNVRAAEVEQRMNVEYDSNANVNANDGSNNHNHNQTENTALSAGLNNLLG